MYVCTYVRMCVCMVYHVCMFVLMYVCMHVCVYECVYVFLQAREVWIAGDTRVGEYLVAQVYYFGGFEVR